MSSPEPIKFTDGAAYERFMAPWSRSAGTLFLDWLAPRPGLAWVDVGAGNGAFTELLLAKSAPSSVCAIDPSEAQIAKARQKFTEREWLDQIIISTAIQAAHTVFDQITSCEQQYWRGELLLPQRATDCQAIFFRKHDVKNECVIGSHFSQSLTFFSIKRGINRVTFVQEAHFQFMIEMPVIFDDENTHTALFPVGVLSQYRSCS